MRSDLINGRWHPACVLFVVIAVLAASTAGIGVAQPAGAQEDDPVKFWTEADSVDGRWNQTDLGRYLASIIALPEGPVRKGLSIRVGDTPAALESRETRDGRLPVTVCYDTEHVALRAAWSGGFLKFDPARYGIIKSPSIDGELLFSSSEGPGWQADDLQYLGMYVHGERVVLRYRVDGTEVLESPWAEGAGSLFSGPPPDARIPNDSQPRKKTAGPIALQIIRTFEIGPHDRPLVLNTGAEVTPQITIPPHSEAQRLEIVYLARPLPDGVQRIELRDEVSIDVRTLTHGGPARWPETVVVPGEPSTNTSQPYVVDKITLPMENPYRALMFVGGHGFFSGDKGPETRDTEPETAATPQPEMAICTMHGEVWTVEGVDADLNRLEWRRFATGLFQPLGMVVVDDLAYVLGRDQITRLHDLNGDGEADYYENFCNRYFTSAGGHDFVACLERDAAGNFYFAHGASGVLRVSPDGQTCEVLATGLRNPNGLGASPDGFVTVAPQQGNWTPSSCIIHVKEGEYYGYAGPKETPDRPLGYDPPLCWIPHNQDNSSGGQAWVTSDRWGPLAGQMLHFSYGQCSMMLTLREEVDGTWQGGNVDFPLRFDSGAMRGRFSPRDGQLYVSGLRGWQNRAVLDGCLARVRYTGRPVDMPVVVKSMQNGLAVTFTRSLERAAAEVISNYGIQRWNYRYSGNYGSPDLRVSDPGKEGRDDVTVRSATLLEDGRTVFLEIPDMLPADQYLVQYAIAASDGTPIEQEFSYTVHIVGGERMDESRLSRRSADDAGLPRELTESLAPGLLLRFEQSSAAIDNRDARRSRLGAWYIAADEPPTPRLEPGPFSVTAEGFLHIRQPGRYRFSLSGSGTASLQIGASAPREADERRSGTEPTSLQPEPMEWLELRLGTGHHPVKIHYESPADADASLRFWWSSDDFRPEPVPPDVLSHVASNEQLAEAEAHYRGRELFVAHNCLSCHRAPDAADFAVDAERRVRAPDLVHAGRRFQPAWLAAWIENPHALRHDATMPEVFASLGESERPQASANLAAFVLTLDEGEAQIHGLTFPEGAAERAALAERGELLYEQLACMACHRLTPPAEIDEHDRVSLHLASAKFRPGALADYLKAPDRYHVSTRMGDFRLADNEALALEAYLRRESVAELVADAPGAADPLQGRELYVTAGCANCHVTEGLEPLFAAPLDFGSPPQAAGCLAIDAASRGEAPAFHWTSGEREALQAFLQSGGRALAQSTPLESAARLVREFRCTACHDRDGEYAPRVSLVLEEGVTGLAPEQLPALTWTGEKLRTDWMEAFLAGRIESPRPWLKSRMPRYADRHAAALAHGLAAEHGLAPNSASEEVPAAKRVNESLAEIGRRLTLQTALDCRQCHGAGEIAPRGDDRTLTAPGINFADVPARLRREFFLRLLHAPQRYDPRTKMPQLAEEGVTKITEHFEGNADMQFEALWQYIESLK